MKLISIKTCLIMMLVIAISLSACSSAIPVSQDKSGSNDNLNKTKPQQKQITLKLWHIWSTDSESNKKPFEKALEDWNTNNPNIKIEAEATENEAYKTKIRTAVAVNEITGHIL